MKCPKCGYPLPEDSLFCQYCGAELISQPVSDHTAEEVEALKIIPTAAPVVSEPVPEPLSEPVPEFVSEHMSEPEPESRTKAPAVDVISEQAKAKEASSTSFVLSAPPASPVAPQQKPTSDSDKQVHCKTCGAIVDNSTKKCTGCGKQYFRAKIVIPCVAITILLIVSVGLNVWQYIHGKDALETIASQTSQIDGLEQKVASLNNTISTQKNTIASQQSTIDSQKKNIESLEAKGDYFDTICKELSSGNIGYAASNFKASESVIVVDKDETNRKFTLAANWSSGGTVEVDYSGFSAYVSFDNNSWTTSTKMTIEPWREGVTAVTFSNDVDSKTFKVIIIVTD